MWHLLDVHICSTYTLTYDRHQHITPVFEVLFLDIFRLDVDVHVQ